MANKRWLQSRVVVVAACGRYQCSPLVLSFGLFLSSMLHQCGEVHSSWVFINQDGITSCAAASSTAVQLLQNGAMLLVTTDDAVQCRDISHAVSGQTLLG